MKTNGHIDKIINVPAENSISKIRIQLMLSLKNQVSTWQNEKHRRKKEAILSTPVPQYQNSICSRLAKTVKITKISTIPMTCKNWGGGGPFLSKIITVRPAKAASINECLLCSRYCPTRRTYVNAVSSHDGSAGSQRKLNKIRIHQHYADWWNEKL